MEKEHARLAAAIAIWTFYHNRAPQTVKGENPSQHFNDSDAKIVAGRLVYRADGHIVDYEITTSTEFYVVFNSTYQKIKVIKQSTTDFKVHDLENHHDYIVRVEDKKVIFAHARTSEEHRFELY